MARKATTGRTYKINRATPDTPSGIERYCRGLEDWPRSWMGWEKDLPPGEQLVARFRPFLEYLVCSGLAPKTLQKHVDNLWALGGEIIRDLNEDPTLRRKTVAQILDARIHEEGGPLLHGIDSEEQQRSFDSTCRKLYRFLSQSSQ